MYWFFSIIVVLITALIVILKKKNMLNWLPHYLWQQLSTAKNKTGPTHILFCFVDHYEPQWGKVNDIEIERARVDRWCQDYPAMAKKHVDSDGKHPQHGFFYPEEEYREEHLQKLANLCNQGYGEIEVHLHHDNDTSDNLRNTLNGFKHLLNERFQALPTDARTGEIKYGFIHGNWCLDNSRPDGRWCGVNDELIVLKETGCYADFTFPSAPSDTQPSKVNAIYYAKDDPLKPKSHNKGKNVKVGGKPWGDLMIIQGPIGLNWKDRKWGIMPRIEASDIRRETPPTKDRVDLWVDANIHVEGRPEWVFIKIHTHGTQDRDMDTILGKPVDDMFSYLGERYNDGAEYILHYVTAREMYNIAKAAEAGESGNPNDYRDYLLTLS
ncbi:MAG: hypothetical protein JKY01_09185 [Pseudomonadales bacterium]|nr:hypothetical protein [Pseudomonadales bacterium]